MNIPIRHLSTHPPTYLPFSNPGQQEITQPANPELQLYKLEQRYTKRKRRTTFISDARYVEFVHSAPSPPLPHATYN